MVRMYEIMIAKADGQPFGKWKIPFFQSQRAMADPVFAFLQLSADEACANLVRRVTLSTAACWASP